jgi:hypothetical protein
MRCIVSVGVTPYLLDHFGRKDCLLGGALVMIMGIVLQVAAQNFAMFVVARFIFGLSNIVIICTFPLLITEIVPSQERAVLAALSTTCPGLHRRVDHLWHFPRLRRSNFPRSIHCPEIYGLLHRKVLFLLI